MPGNQHSTSKVLTLMLPVHFATRAESPHRAESQWRYDPSDPYMVEIRIAKSGIRWRIPRDVVLDATVAWTSDAPYQLGPSDGNLVTIRRGTDDKAVLSVGRADLQQFLSQTRSLVALGDEVDYADFSRLLSAEPGMELG